MENVNLREIRSKLKHGDIAIIAKRCNCNTRQVAEVLNKGRECDGRYEEIVEAALDLLKGEAEQKKNILAKAKEAGFSTTNFSRSAYRPKRRNKFIPGKRKGGSPVIYIVGAGVALLAVLFGKKLLAKL